MRRHSATFVRWVRCLRGLHYRQVAFVDCTVGGRRIPNSASACCEAEARRWLVEVMASNWEGPTWARP